MPDRTQPLSTTRAACRPGLGGLTRAAADRGRVRARCHSHTTAYGLEELPECRRQVLNVLRQPLEKSMMTIAHTLIPLSLWHT